MKLPPDSCFPVLLAVLLLPFLLANGPAAAVTAKKTAKPPAAAAIEPQPDPTTLIAQSRDAQGKGETELALRLAQSAIVADPARPSSYDALADIYAANHVPDAALSYYKAALAIDPTDAAAQAAVAALDRSATDKRAARVEGMKPGIP